MNTLFLILFCVLQIGDIHTTIKALEMGHREANPFLNHLFQKFDPLFVMIVTKFIAIGLLWYVNFWPITAAMCVLYIWVVWNNWNLIKK